MAYEFYVSIEGTKQGKFKGESGRDDHKAKLPGFYFSSNVISPRDNATGQSTGKRRHDPVVFKKPVGAATPQIAQALTTNEVLKSVLFEFVRMTEAGKEEVAFTIKLTNATVSGSKIFLPDATDEKQHVDLSEEVALTFQKIEWESKVGKTTAIDDWAK